MNVVSFFFFQQIRKILTKSIKTAICENLDCWKLSGILWYFPFSVDLATKWYYIHSHINKDALGHLQQRTHYVYCYIHMCTHCVYCELVCTRDHEITFATRVVHTPCFCKSRNIIKMSTHTVTYMASTQLQHPHNGSSYEEHQFPCDCSSEERILHQYTPHCPGILRQSLVQMQHRT